MTAYRENLALTAEVGTAFGAERLPPGPVTVVSRR